MNKKKPKSSAQHAQTPAPSIQQNKQAIATLQSFSGPLPHPELLRNYNEIIPGAAERILSMAEAEAAQQHNMERLALQCASSEARLGQWFGLIIGICAFITVIIAVILGAEKTAMVVGGTTVVGLVTVFVAGHKPQPNE